MQPLKGLKVVDLTTFLATPTTGRILGEWGADVIKVEAFKGDPCRTNQAVVFGMPSSDEENLAFDVANFHKRFVALNLKSEKGNEVKVMVTNDAPSKLAARRKMMAYLYDYKQERNAGESRSDYRARTKDVNHPLVEKIFGELAPKYDKRREEVGQGGGYTRILKKGPRKGDAAETVILELV